MQQDYRENHLKVTEFWCDIGHLGGTLVRNYWAGWRRAGGIRTIIKPENTRCWDSFPERAWWVWGLGWQKPWMAHPPLHIFHAAKCTVIGTYWARGCIQGCTLKKEQNSHFTSKKGRGVRHCNKNWNVSLFLNRPWNIWPLQTKCAVSCKEQSWRFGLIATADFLKFGTHSGVQEQQ